MSKKRIILIVIGVLVIILAFVNYYSTDLVAFMCSPNCSKSYDTIALAGSYDLNVLSAKAKEKGYSADFGMGGTGIISKFGNDEGEDKNAYQSMIIQINKNLYEIVEKHGRIYQPSLTPMYVQINKPRGDINYWSFQLNISDNPKPSHYKIRQQLKQTFEELGIETAPVSKINIFTVHYKME